MKKIISISAILLSIGLIFTGCGETSTSTSTNVTPEPTEIGTYKYIDVKMCDSAERTDGKGEVLKYSEKQKTISELFVEVNSGIERQEATKKQIKDTLDSGKPGILIKCTDDTQVRVFTVYNGKKASKKLYLFEVTELGNVGYFVINSETMVDYLKEKNLDKVFGK